MGDEAAKPRASLGVSATGTRAVFLGVCRGMPKVRRMPRPGTASADPASHPVPEHSDMGPCQVLNAVRDLDRLDPIGSGHLIPCCFASERRQAEWAARSHLCGLPHVEDVPTARERPWNPAFRWRITHMQ